MEKPYTSDVSKITEAIRNTEFDDDIRHEAVIFHDDPVIAAKSFLSHVDLDITAVEYTDNEITTREETNENDLINTILTKYAEILTNWRSSLFIVLAIFSAVVVCAVYSLTQHPIPDFSDPSKGFEARGTVISKRLISIHHLLYSASIPNSLITQPTLLVNSDRHNTYPPPGLIKPTSVTKSLATPSTKYLIASSTTKETYGTTGTQETQRTQETHTQEPHGTQGTKQVSKSKESLAVVKTKFNTSMISSNEVPTNVIIHQNADEPIITDLIAGSEDPPQVSEIYDRQRRFSNSDAEQCITIDKDFIGVVFKSNIDDSNIFTKDGLQSICRWQRQTHKKYYSHFPSCTLLSVADFVLHLNNKTKCEDILDSDVQATYDLIETCAGYYYNSALRENCATRICNVPRNCSQLNAIYDILHYLTDSEFYNTDDISSGNSTNLTSTLVFIPLIMSEYNNSLVYDILDGEFQRKKVVENGASRIVALKVDRYDVFYHYFWRDTFLVGGSASCIVFVIWFYSKSLFITCMTLLNFLLSLSLAYFTYIVVVQVQFFPFLAVTTGLLIVAIGADDTFVFLEIWQESKVFEENKLNAMARTLRHAAPTMFVTSLTTSSAFFINMISSITAVRCFGLYAGTAILFNFLLTLSWLPSVIILNDIIQENISFRRFMSCLKSFSSLSEKIIKFSDTFFKVCLPYLIIRFRYLWIILFSYMGFAGAYVIFVSPGLSLPQSNFPVFDDTNMIEMYEAKYKDQFRFEKDGASMPILNMQFIWGVTPADNGNHWNPDDRGNLVLGTALDFNPNVQKWMLDFCASIRLQDFYAFRSARDENCFMEKFVKFMTRDCIGSSSMCCGMLNTTFDTDTFNRCLPLVVRRYQNLKDYIYFDNNGNILGARVQFPSNYTLSRMYTPMNDYWSEVNSWSEKELSTAPEGLSGGWFITEYNMIQLYFYDLQKSLVKSSSFSLLTSIALAAIILFIVTRNVLLSAFAMLSIMGTIFVTIGSLVVLGWELNVMESVVFSLAVGLSVDFTIHYGVAYRLAPYPDRQSRVGFSVRSLAPAITMAAFSTFVPGACMFSAICLIYQQMAVFLTLIMSVSLTFSTFFFQSLCYIIGPQENTCELNIFCCDSTATDYEVSNKAGAKKDSNLVVVEFK